MHVAHTLDCVANVFERTRCAIHFQVFENVVECDGYALVEFCRLLERFEIEGRVGDENLLDGFDVFVFRLRCHLYCRRGRRSLFRQRSSKRQMRFALRKRICAPQRRHKRVGFLFAHFTRLFAMI